MIYSLPLFTAVLYLFSLLSSFPVFGSNCLMLCFVEVHNNHISFPTEVVILEVVWEIAVELDPQVASSVFW